MKWVYIILIIVALLLLGIFITSYFSSPVIDDFRPTFIDSGSNQTILVKTFCEEYCKQSLEANISPKESNYCIKKFKIEVEGKMKEVICPGPEIAVDCALNCE